MGDLRTVRGRLQRDDHVDVAEVAVDDGRADAPAGGDAPDEPLVRSGEHDREVGLAGGVKEPFRGGDGFPAGLGTLTGELVGEVHQDQRGGVPQPMRSPWSPFSNCSRSR